MRLQLAIALLLFAPAALHAQEQKTIARYGFVDGALEISVRPQGIIAVAGAQGNNAATVAVRVSDARAWVDSTRRFLARAAPRRRTVLVLQRSMITEAADSGAALSFLRHADFDSTKYSLLFSTRRMGKFPLELERREAALFFGAMRRAIDSVSPPRAKPSPKVPAKPRPKAP